jgi:16S rRNA (guanine527-N7)-methyltransferase
LKETLKICERKKVVRKYLLEGMKKIGVELEEKTIDSLLVYADLLYEYNQHTNLTAIRDREDMLEKHFIDSLLVYKNVSWKSGRAIDIGTGAGFPGMVLAICRRDVEFTLMDSVGKKTKFLEIVKEKLNLDNVIVVNKRAEEYIDNYRETYDFGFCRGVNRLNVILEYVLPFIKVDGYFFPQKLEHEEEVLESINALDILNGKILEIFEEKLPFCEDRRSILKIHKVSPTPEKYPRRTGVPLKRPL